MANTVIALKKSATPSAVPVDLANGEIALNYSDGVIFYKHANGTVAAISSGGDNYGTVNANGTLIVADTQGDILTLIAGSNIQIVGDAINDTITISATAGSGDITSAITQANVARDHANAAFLQANTAGTDAVNAFAQANTARDRANTGVTDAGAAFAQANTARTGANTVGGYANSAYGAANLAWTQANTALTTGQGAYGQANTATTNAGNAFGQANTALTTGQAAFNKANTAGVGATIFTDTVNATRYVVFDDATSGSFTQANVSTSLTFNPSTGTLSATIFNSTSDINLKYDIGRVNNAMEIVNRINGVKFKWKDNDNSSFGVIAQEVEKVLPELVVKDKYTTVNYNGLIAVLIEAVKELKTEIEELKSK